MSRDADERADHEGVSLEAQTCSGIQQEDKDAEGHDAPHHRAIEVARG